MGRRSEHWRWRKNDGLEPPMTRNGTIATSLGGAWGSLSRPVMALAEELALRRAAGGRPDLVLHVRGGGIDALRRDGPSQRLLFTVAGRPAQAVQLAVEQLAGQLGPDIALTLAEDQAVSQQIVLPLQPDDVLRAIVRNKVESLAPWPLAQCLWGMRVSPVAGDPLHVAVDVAVVSRAMFETLSATLRAAGAEVKALFVTLADGGEVEIGLGSSDIRRAARALATRASWLAAAVIGLLLGAGLFSIYRIDAEAGRLEQESAAMVAALKPSGGALAGETPLVAAANRLRQQRAARPSAVAVLDEVTRLLPDNVHLTFFGLSADELVLKGQGSGVPELIGLLESSPGLQAVNFAAATELDQNSRTDSFSLSARLEAGGAGSAP